jgi:hypothetical protein
MFLRPKFINKVHFFTGQYLERNILTFMLVYCVLQIGDEMGYNKILDNICIV